jgi:non-ribosomal peptide synthetase component F
LKAGGAYVPLEPSYPVERLAYMLTDAQPSVLLTHQALLKDLPSYEGTLVCLDTAWPSLEKESPTALRHAITPNHLAYIIYTSGSTGRPKGAMNTHQGIGNRLQWMQATY